MFGKKKEKKEIIREEFQIEEIVPLDDRRKKALLFYNPHSGNGLFKNNLDLIIEKFQEKDIKSTPVLAAH